MTIRETADRRSHRTRRAIVDAFGRLILRSHRPPIRTTDMIAEAGVGRSTFYEHFSGTDQIHMAALARPFGVLADIAVGLGDTEKTAVLLRHFWENRQRARDFLNGRRGEQAQRLLANLIEERLDASHVIAPRILAWQLAAAAYAPLRAWLLGEVAATPEMLAETLCRTGAALASSARDRL